MEFWFFRFASRHGAAFRGQVLATCRTNRERGSSPGPIVRDLAVLDLKEPVSSVVHWHCLAFGRVQGVNYRARVAEAARRHGVVGAVANRTDGTVFIDVQGSVEAVEAFLRDVSGPRGRSHAHVVQRVSEVPVSPDLFRFEILLE
jgi:acylphosphatase